MPSWQSKDSSRHIEACGAEPARLGRVAGDVDGRGRYPDVWANGPSPTVSEASCGAFSRSHVRSQFTLLMTSRTLLVDAGCTSTQIARSEERLGLYPMP